jgi:hypothetical protein
MKFSLLPLLCYLGFHQHEVVDVKFGFGNSGKIMTFKCKNCGGIKIKTGD